MTPEGLLDLWERCARATPWTRACVLAAWDDDSAVHDVARRPLGEGQALLVSAWRALVGSSLDAVVDCPACAEALEVSVDPEALPLSPPARPPPAVVDDDGEARVPRLLTAEDLDAVAGLPPEEARRELAHRALGVPEPSAALQHAVAEALEAADPASTCWLQLSCPACGHGWEEPLHLAELLWHAVEAAAARLLADVADLAAAFGWSEAAVLALPPARRTAYLELAVR